MFEVSTVVDGLLLVVVGVVDLLLLVLFWVLLGDLFIAPCDIAFDVLTVTFFPSVVTTIVPFKSVLYVV